MNGMIKKNIAARPYIRKSHSFVQLEPINIADVEQVKKRMNWYLKECLMVGKNPTITGFCNILGISRRTFYRWEAGIDRGREHQLLATKYKNLLCAILEEEMLDGKINPIVGIFLLKNNFGYKDKQEYSVSPNPNTNTVCAENIQQYYIDEVVAENE